MPTVDLPAGPIHYVEHGDGPAVVLLHGVFMNHLVWDEVIDRLPGGFRYVLPDLPLGSHPEPMHPDAELSLRGLVQLVADFLEALDLNEVTLVHSDWGGALFLTAYGLDERVGSLILLPCEAFDNFPPGLPGTMAVLAARIPGGLTLALRMLRVRWLRGTPPLLGSMARKPLPERLIRAWSEPGLRDRRVLRDLRKYGTTRLVDSELVAATEALRHFTGPALVLWSSAGKVMPRSHGHRLAQLLPNAALVEIDDAYVLSMLDRPEAVAQAMSEFLVGGRSPQGHDGKHAPPT